MLYVSTHVCFAAIQTFCIDYEPHTRGDILADNSKL